MGFCCDQMKLHVYKKVAKLQRTMHTGQTQY